jgi:hypothetical protein
VAWGVDSASNRNEYQKSFLGGKDGRCAGLTTLPPSCADCLEILEPQPPGLPRAGSGIAFQAPTPCLFAEILDSYGDELEVYHFLDQTTRRHVLENDNIQVHEFESQVQTLNG